MKVKVINSNGFVHKGEIKKLNDEFDMTKKKSLRRYRSIQKPNF